LVGLAGGRVARDTLPTELRHVRFVREPQVLAREADLFANVRLSVAAAACARVVRARVTADARSSVREMKRIAVLRIRDAFVARLARDADDGVFVVLERMLRLLGLDPEKAGACRERDGEHQDREAEQRASHRPSLS
jgi:hypothetical protein